MFIVPSRAPKMVQKAKVSVVGVIDFPGRRWQRGSFLLFETRENHLPPSRSRQGIRTE